jgi:hypothetical protein
MPTDALRKYAQVLDRIHEKVAPRDYLRSKRKEVITRAKKACSSAGRALAQCRWGAPKNSQSTRTTLSAKDPPTVVQQSAFGDIRADKLRNATTLPASLIKRRS